MHPRKFLWFAKFNIMGDITVEKQFGNDIAATNAIKSSFQDGLTHRLGKDSCIVYPPARIVSIELERREATEEQLQWHSGPRWNI